MLPERPKLRPVEAFPIELRKDERAVALRDPLGITTKMVAIPPAVFALIALFDGQRTIVDVQAEWARRTGELVFSEQIEGFLRTLDENLFLEGERFERARADLVEAFRRSAVRPAAHAGAAYPSEPAKLREFLRALFLRPGGPGRVPGEGGATSGSEPGRLAGVVAPHIDPRQGDVVYAHAFDAVARAGGADLYIIFGTAHQGGEDLYAFTKKAFETPLGTVATDRAFIERLEDRLGGRPLDGGEISHRTEHSIEFEVVFLKFVEDLLGKRPPARIVPLLCGSFTPFTGSGRSPAEAESVARLVEALRAEIAAEEARGTRVLSIAAADLAHIGLKFGHERRADARFARECEEKDRAALEHAAKPDAEGFFDSIARERDERNICGLPCIYTMLKTLEPGGAAGAGALRGSLLAYGQAPDPAAGSLVSFAALAYYA